jgi:AhpC/TSA family protein/cytochrome c biogenesis DsbD-like protein
VELQSRLDELKKQGLGLVAISYDSSQTLKAFSDSRRITFPLVSDPGSAIIRRFGLLNTTVEPGSATFGIPFPGTFIVDRRGTVRSRHFEEAYQERNTAASLLVRQGATALGPAVIAETPHLMMTAAVSDDKVAPGERLSLVFDIAPRRGIHIYAPGKHTYQVVRITFAPQPWLRAHETKYPPSEIYTFKPLDERVEVYQQPFRLVQDVTILATREAQKLLANQSSIALTGRLEYQACDDKVCYKPESVPVRWTLELKPLDRK